MKCATVFLAAAVLALNWGVAVEGARENGGTPMPAKKYALNLDLPPEKRWLPILQVYNSSIPLLMEYYKNLGTEFDSLKTLLADMNGYFGEYGDEMKSIAKFMGIDLGVVVTLNLSYELRRLEGGRINTTGNVTGNLNTQPNASGAVACSSILALDKSGTVFHGRTLDWYIPANMRNLTVQIDFMRGGDVVFTGDVVVGTVGVATGISKAGGFSLSINERNLGGNILNNGINALLKKSKCPTMAARDVLTSSNSFLEAVETLKEEQLIAPVYYILAGEGHSEGAVLTRSRTKCLDLWLLNSHNSTGNRDSMQPWYLLETNYDHWKEPEPYDNRRGYGIKYLNEMGQEKAASVKGLQSVLAMWPIRSNYTSSSAVMVPTQFSMESDIIYP